MCLSTLNWTNLPLRQADLRRIKQKDVALFWGFKMVSNALREGGVLFIQVYNDRAKAGFHYTQSFRSLDCTSLWYLYTHFFVKRSSWTNKPPALSWRETWYFQYICTRWLTGILRIVWDNPHVLSSQPGWTVHCSGGGFIGGLFVVLFVNPSILFGKKNISNWTFFFQKGVQEEAPIVAR